jgi:hypothetical protein
MHYDARYVIYNPPTHRIVVTQQDELTDEELIQISQDNIGIISYGSKFFMNGIQVPWKKIKLYFGG